MLDADAPGEPQDGVDVQPLRGNHAGGGFDLFGRKTPPDERQDVSVLALSLHPVFVLFVLDGLKADVHIQFGGLEEQFFHHLPRVSLVNADENA